MMNARILELIKNPDLIIKDDLGHLESQIKEQPYTQSIRALYLYGVHTHQQENYQNILSTTAAFTTDKKILYQFINKVPVQQNVPEFPVVENNSPPETITPEPESSFTAITSTPKPTLKPVYVNGKLNRILFEGEEDFLESEHEVIDLEQTRETGLIVTQSVKKQEESTSALDSSIHSSDIKTPQTTDLPKINDLSHEAELPVTMPLQNVQPEKVTEQEPEQPKTESLNFHGTEQFLPDVKPIATPARPQAYQVPKSTPNKYELEMQRLIAEVEAKVKTQKKSVPQEDEKVSNETLDFAVVQEFGITENKTKEETAGLPNDKPTEIVSSDSISESAHNTAKDSKVEKPSEKRHWKPMSIEGTTPDSLIKKEVEAVKKSEIQSEITREQPAVTTDSPLKSDQTRAFNISFFTQKVSSIETEKAEDLIQDVKKHVEEDVQKEESNVPVFINTWQNWLKIDKSKEDNAEKFIISKEEEKNKVIETFIVKEPRISKLREESDFVVKERGDNISHLMTETLAKLYVEQKLYAKAIKAYQTLTQKHPEKKSYFAEQIKLIKDLRQTK